MNEVIQCLISRRSAKGYKPEQIKDEDLDLILKAGTYAANGMGAQSATMVVLQDPKEIQQLQRMNAAVLGNPEKQTFYGAPTVIVVVANQTVNTYVEDGSLVIGNLMNAAYSLGIDSCWIHRAKEELQTPEGQQLLKQWGLDENYVGVGHCILGYRSGPEREAIARKENYIIKR